MKFFSPRLTVFALLLGGFFFLSSCLSNTDNSRPSSLQFGLHVENMDTTLTDSNSDSIQVDQFGIVLGDLVYKTSSDSLTLNTNDNPVPLALNANSRNPVVITGRNISKAGLYQSFKLSIPRAKDGNNQTDLDFVDSDGTRYTMIFKGTYNDTSFTYKSEQVIERTFSLGSIDVPAEGARLLRLIDLNIEEIFRGGSGILDPRKEGNIDQIDGNIMRTLDLISPSDLQQ